MSTAPIIIGSMVPLTGTSANDGREFRNGLSMAIDEVNARGGILGRRLEAEFVDTGNQSAVEVVRAARQLIHQHRASAIINGYNIGPQNAEYEPIADAGIIYIHHNTLVQHHDTVASDPTRYFGCFMGDPAEYWYGQGFIKFLSWLRDSHRWRPRNRRVAIISGPKPYSIVIANAMAVSAPKFGWELPIAPQIHPTNADWREALEKIRVHDPAIVAMTHFHAGDLARFHLQFMEKPLPSLLYLQYGALHSAFSEITGEKARGVITCTVIGLPRDEIGKKFAANYRARFGPLSTPEIGCQPYSSLHHYAIAAAVAGGTGEPGNGEINRRIAKALIDIPYRSVVGMIHYHPTWQAAVPYPDATQDPSLGIPHLFYQLRSPGESPALIAPEPYIEQPFELPPWL
ncbi:MAG: ABC transporter substrate-binding protein [Proteobacteria bacterium]|nr:ABC transporter substrate-binding protein [Pseudomonadota bacterium]